MGSDPLKILSCMCFYRNRLLDPPPGKIRHPLNPVPTARRQPRLRFLSPQRIYMLFQGFRRGPIFPGGGGVQMLFPIETHLTYDVPGLEGGGPDKSITFLKF